MALSRLDNLYRQMILDHAAHPHHHGKLTNAKQQLELRNPTCGDVLQLEVSLDDGKISEIAFSGTGCTISQASASMMTDEVLHKTPAQVEKMVTTFSELVTGQDPANADEILGDAAILEGVTQFPARIKCATLAWKAIYQILAEVQD
ncbi:Fe-S cluster assembly sulfur transfer protein SufU [Liquorilactobacillus satsumensis]|nr:SUF system NifU family Fe-S cluster assembly protein [Liquorilactobacillus satsumensis]MCC7667329.1 SUF system NifU family Fe-S cluster assembly protein [Liquorilactobacillus satsumensis]MCP9312370.1 SUF system NifU family Fe-S cluster assembly protein [Liquorilactobacillus satsumensis]MCP9327655.1 SUF system NifU family Fe-S cluster assembly protein [Liquorilactobacillus satsumensis]MCP9357073.1 SUF system NifU family Fe-S cluster assembly protein [Liquorilactobacillus satsumensis]MCP93596